MLERFRGEDWNYVYFGKSNRFIYLGNGFSTKELDGSDSTWYLKDLDDALPGKAARNAKDISSI